MDKRFLFLGLFLLTGCSRDSVTFNYFYFDTPIEVQIYDNNINDVDIKEGIESILKTNELKYSNYDEGSTISQLNEQRVLEVDQEFISILKMTNDYCELTNAKYDVGSGMLIDSWSISNEDNVVEDVDGLVNSKCDEYSIDGNTVSLYDGAKLDFGSAIKGYTGDQIHDYLLENGVESAMINIGGNVDLVGTKYSEQFNIGINDPFIGGENTPIMSVFVADKNVITSGINQRYFESDGVVYHHLLDATTGYPHNSSVQSVTVIGEDGLKSDILSTVLYLMDFEDAFEYSKTLDDYTVVFITNEKEIYMSNEIHYELLSQEYQVVK